MLTLVADGSYLYLYINGQMVDCVSCGATYTSYTTANLFVGNHYASDAACAFTWDEFGVWSSGLSGTSVFQLYRGGVNSHSVPVRWYKFDEGSGTSVGDSGSSPQTLTVSGAAPGWVTGQVGAFALNFSGRQANGSDAGMPSGNADFTVSVWGRPASTGTHVVLRSGTNGSAGRMIEPYISAGTLAFYDGASGYSIGSSGHADGTWHHYVWRYTASTGELKAYVDGTSVGTTTIHMQFLASGTFYVGADTSSQGNSWAADMDDLRVYNVALTDAEVAAIP
jgi:hypothetical protein